MTPERIAFMRRSGLVNVSECLVEIERLQAEVERLKAELNRRDQVAWDEVKKGKQ